MYEKQKDVTCVYLCFVILFLFALVRLLNFLHSGVVVIVPIRNVTDGINYSSISRVLFAVTLNLTGQHLYVCTSI